MWEVSEGGGSPKLVPQAGRKYYTPLDQLPQWDKPCRLLGTIWGDITTMSSEAWKAQCQRAEEQKQAELAQSDSSSPEPLAPKHIWLPCLSGFERVMACLQGDSSPAGCPWGPFEIHPARGSCQTCGGHHVCQPHHARWSLQGHNHGDSYHLHWKGGPWANPTGHTKPPTNYRGYHGPPQQGKQ